MDAAMRMGIVVALVTAMLQSGSYVLSRMFFSKGYTSMQLVFAAQMVIMLVSIIAWPFVVRGVDVFRPEVMAWMGLTTGGYMLGQCFWLNAMRKIEASRIASLYGIKILFVGLLYMLLLHNGGLSIYMFVGVFMAVSAVALMNYQRGGSFSMVGMVPLGLAIVGFSFSDIGAVGMMPALDMESRVSAAIVSTLCNNILAGLLLLPFWKKIGFEWKQMPCSAPYALCYLVSVMSIFYCFSVLDPVYTNVIVAIRGIFSLLLGWLLARLGYTALESRATRVEWLRRGAAATLMFAAIVVYSYGKIRIQNIG